MTGERRSRVKAWSKGIALAAAGGLATFMAEKTIVGLGRAATIVVETAFESTAAAAKSESEMKDEYRALNNDSRNIEAEHYRTISRALIDHAKRSDEAHEGMQKTLDIILTRLLNGKH